jgi:hypothetical protein
MTTYRNPWQTDTGQQQAQGEPAVTTTTDSNVGDVNATIDGGGPIAGAINNSPLSVEEVQIALMALLLAIEMYRLRGVGA